MDTVRKINSIRKEAVFVKKMAGKVRIMEYHVSVNGEDGAKGTEEYPFQSISRAAAVAVAGDTITVHAGIYREWVNPENGGTGEARIVYRAAGDGETVITGAEPIKEWKRRKRVSKN